MLAALLLLTFACGVAVGIIMSTYRAETPRRATVGAPISKPLTTTPTAFRYPPV